MVYIIMPDAVASGAAQALFGGRIPGTGKGSRIMTGQNTGIFMRKWMAAALFAPALFLMGCSSGDTDLLELPEDEANEQATGFAYDGYLIGARVCVDLNLNKFCDSGEPSDITGLQGEFEITGLTAAQKRLPLVLEATPTTVDSETGAVDDNLRYLAPPGSTSINAYSTIIQMKIEQALADGSTETLADLRTQKANELATELGVTVDLTQYNPIAAKNDTGLSAGVRQTAAELSLASKVLSEQIATLVPAANANANGDFTAAFGALVEELDAADVISAVQNDTSGLALQDLVNATADQVTTETAPTAPTTMEIQAQAAEDDAYEDAASTGENTNEPTGGTGGTNP
jgi:hypothetical protein